ncbi:10055_t:CDS:2 [Diversispora eburnea]|uniref:10055_t:CDS:1 n=1 Tax=Diversispora eburnea TaxID=1213867 RepID=A0A9N9FV28_9GLOM|nr:10055_t:CDS:2 [Diversispora eburnea]
MIGWSIAMETKYYDKSRDYEDYKERYEEVQEELIERAKAEEKLESAKARELGLTKLLEDTKTELSLVRVEKDNQVAIFENKLDQKSALLENIRQELKNLEIKSEKEKAEKNSEVKEKDSELKEKEKELKQKEEEVKKSQRKAGQSREELLSEKSRLKEEKLKAFTTPLGVSLQQFNNLRRYYERLTDARKNFNQANIETHEDNVAVIEEEFRQANISVENIQKILVSSEEKEEANKKIQEINKAYEILGDEEMKRRYDNGEEFTSDFSGYDYEGEIKEEFRRREEELRKAKVDVIDIELEILKLEMKSLDRSSTINEIGMAFNLTYPRVFKENLDSKL